MTEMPYAAPYVSLLVICGDAGLSTLGRMLSSVTQRGDGKPMVDEIVLGWNGKDDTGLRLELALGGVGENESILLTDRVGDVMHLPRASPALTILRQEWKKDFALARNEVMALCRGEWIMWADSDDIVASATDVSGPDGLKAINDVERSYGYPITPPPDGARSGSSFSEFLKTLPYSINCILAPYDYAILADNSVTIRQTMRRVLRRNAGWVWRSFSGVHEIPYPAGIVGEASIYTCLLNRHRPAVGDVSRLDRNSEIILAKLEGDEAVVTADARHAYDVATMHIARSDMTKAIESINKALLNAPTPEDHFRYLLTRYSLLATIGKLQEAARDALNCITLMPDRNEGYFAASEAYYLMGLHRACVRYYEMGASLPVAPSSLDLVVNRVVRPRANAAISLCALGEPERGALIALEAVKEFPNDALALRAYAQASDAANKKKALEGGLLCTEYLLLRSAYSDAAALLEALNGPATRGTKLSPKYRQLKARLTALWRPLASPPPEPEGVRAALVSRWSPVEVDFYPKGGEAIDVEALCASRVVLEAQESDAGLMVAYRRFIPGNKRISFYCPVGVLDWNPLYPEKVGLGGSESSVIFLARELAARGHLVKLYCPEGGPAAEVDQGVLWYKVSAFDPTDSGPTKADVIIACRAPWLAHTPGTTAPIWAWHQDNGYGAAWSWSQEVSDQLAGNLHVSTWARKGLLAELQREPFPNDHQEVMGNGVSEDWVMARLSPANRPARNPLKVVYASDPLRGMDTLLRCWPSVLKVIPDAELHLFSDFTVAAHMLQTGGSAPTSKLPIDRFKELMFSTPRVFVHGRVGQQILRNELLGAGVYAYPGGTMPEGFGVVLAQASAAGCSMVFPDAGALPDVLPDHRYKVPEVVTEKAAQRFLDALVHSLQRPLTEAEREVNSEETWQRHGWPHVADRFEKFVLRGE